MATARVFKSGNSQAVRLPKKFRVNSKELEISRRGDEIVLREKSGGLERAFEILANLPEDALPRKRKDRLPQPRRKVGMGEISLCASRHVRGSERIRKGVGLLRPK
jgi:antitoxin VapB